MSSRETMLAGLRSSREAAPALPDLADFGVTYDEVISQFETALAAVGGTLLRAQTMADTAALLAEMPVAKQAECVFSTVPEVAKSNVDLEEVRDPSELNGLGLAIVRGEFAVAENGAVWVDPTGLAHRVVLFIAEHLVLIVRESEVVHNMHQAYQRLGTELPNYGLFISGPSKTADIEQSLVIGAQGPRSLHVCLVAE